MAGRGSVVAAAPALARGRPRLALLSPVRRWPAWTAALAVLAVGALALTLTHRQPRQPLPGRVAIADALANPLVRRDLAGIHWRAAASALDGRSERVSFYAGSRMILDVLLSDEGTVRQLADFRAGGVPYGDWIAYQPAMLALLGTLFALMVGVLPLRRMRNLDVLAALSLLAPVVLFEHRYVAASAISSAPGMLWLTVRCALRALRPPARVPESPKRGSRPLLEALTPGWAVARRIGVLRLVLAALVLVYLMVGIGSPSADDVAYAVMEGATRMIGGVLPYGHLPGDVFHGDTYPILSYALYTPLAALSPVPDIFSSVDLALAASVVAVLVTAAMLARASAHAVAPPAPASPPQGPSRPPAGATAQLAGLRAAIALLSFPPLLITASTGTTDAALGAMLLAAVLLWRAPGASASMLALAAWFKLAPAALFAVWLAPWRGRLLARALAGLLGVSLACAALVVALGGLGGLVSMAHAIGYQFHRASPQSAWNALGIESLQPLGEAMVLALIAGGAVRLWREPGIAADRARLCALSAAVMLGLQFTSSQWAFMYLAWALPLAGLSLFAEPASMAVLGDRPRPAGRC